MGGSVIILPSRSASRNRDMGLDIAKLALDPQPPVVARAAVPIFPRLVEHIQRSDMRRQQPVAGQRQRAVDLAVNRDHARTKIVRRNEHIGRDRTAREPDISLGVMIIVIIGAQLIVRGADVDAPPVAEAPGIADSALDPEEPSVLSPAEGEGSRSVGVQARRIVIAEPRGGDRPPFAQRIAAQPEIAFEPNPARQLGASRRGRAGGQQGDEQPS